jgi:hypothetical protein
MKVKILMWSLNGDLNIGVFDRLGVIYGIGKSHVKTKSDSCEADALIPVSFIEVYVNYCIVARVDVLHLDEHAIEQEKKRLSEMYNNACSLAHYCHYQEEGFKLDYFEEVI